MMVKSRGGFSVWILVKTVAAMVTMSNCCDHLDTVLTKIDWTESANITSAENTQVHHHVQLDAALNRTFLQRGSVVGVTGDGHHQVGKLVQEWVHSSTW